MLRIGARRLNNSTPLGKSSTIATSSLFEHYGSERPAELRQLADLYYAPACLSIRRPKLGSDSAFKKKVKAKLYLQAAAARSEIGMPTRLKKK